MLKTKLLSVFVAFALIVTVGGVYASWIYTDAATVNEINYTSGNHIFELSVLEQPTSQGTLEFGTTTLKGVIDDPKDDGVDRKACLSYDGEISIIFTPDETFLASGDPFSFELLLSNNASLVWTDSSVGGTATSIFHVYTEGIVLSTSDTSLTVLDGETVLIPGCVEGTNESGDTIYTWTISADIISKLVHLRATDITLPTLSDYNAFEDLLADNKIGIKVRGYVAP